MLTIKDFEKKKLSTNPKITHYVYNEWAIRKDIDGSGTWQVWRARQSDGLFTSIMLQNIPTRPRAIGALETLSEIITYETPDSEINRIVWNMKQSMRL